MIQIEHISKTYKVPIREGGIKEAIRALYNRQYQIIKALDDISYTIPKGQIVGYIGPNGAGKSTTIKIMTGILQPDTGSCTINGRDPFRSRKEHAQQIGVVFGQRTQLWWDIPVIDSFELLKDIYAITDEDYQHRLSELSTLLDLNPLLKIPTRQLSLGQRMRCDIAAALIHNPKVLFLDEPTIGLDAPSKIAVRRFIKSINKRFETTIVLTTHDMQDIESLVDRIILIGKGRILFDGTMRMLKNQYELEKQIKIRFNGRLIEHSSYVIELQDDQTATLRVVGAVSDAVRVLSDTVDIVDMEIVSTSLDDIIVKAYEAYQI
ncbi:ATP-binding cassette domain-containing protein [Erysipelothrix anatis]|uniref:ABC transporter ATP-binding protein n=1 Tax=Erysipelothrix anatis TaxID=2683713 RepID=UPI00135CBB6D|nr:ATP-binding cassette domain-containing protein [Erysipelothrix anatis]